ncbi:HAD-IA family hydrolase [Phyllobacterium zundukense]|uniref:HAD-IA family hydrolase n=1 Tax=Phyllobacterium zundukense TaxID=1867719 RepID=A0ACD4CV97_9HYPH|nr:HAD-IA family hydrolase [Phyllobacterium zundukense]UXN57478.1 HAD-IA family hydrolase [Phyllobacterium zundukense]
MHSHPSTQLTKSFLCKAILFDMDGTLVDSTAVVERLWAEWCNKNGKSLQDVLALAHGRRDIDVIAEIAPELDVLQEAEDFLRREVTQLEGVLEVPGAAALLKRLPAHSWACVTSASRNLAVARMRAAGLPIPEVLISAEMVEAGKPSPEGYLKAASALGISAAECVIFEDAMAGIQAGINAHAVVIAVTSIPTGVFIKHQPRINNFNEITCTVLEDGGLELRLAQNSKS